jgi:ureidoglycolate lyase
MTHSITLRRRFEPMTAEAFARYGSLVEIGEPKGYPINGGTTMRSDSEAALVLGAGGGRPLLSTFVVQPVKVPLTCTRLERHPMSSQLFMPLMGRRFGVVVALGDAAPDPTTLRAFVTNGRQGVNYAPGIWHHPAIALDDVTEFLVVGRQARGAAEDFDLAAFPDEVAIELS